MMLSSRYLYDHRVNDIPVKIHYSYWGSAGEPVLLLHGLADHGLVWSSLGEALADRYQVVAPDLRGHGDSSKPEQGYDAEQIISDLRGLIYHLGWTQVHILGHSWSAKVLCQWATRHPEDFASLILVDPFFIRRIPGWIQGILPLLYRVLPFLKTMGPFESYEQAEAVGRSLKQYRGWSDLQRAAFAFGLEEKANGQWGSKFTVPARNQIFADAMASSGLTQPVSIPTLLIKPQQGLNRLGWQLQPCYDYLTQLEVVTIPGNHWVFLTDPDRFNATVREFLDQISTPAIA